MRRDQVPWAMILQLVSEVVIHLVLCCAVNHIVYVLVMSVYTLNASQACPLHMQHISVPAYIHSCACPLTAQHMCALYLSLVKTQ